MAGVVETGRLAPIRSPIGVAERRNSPNIHYSLQMKTRQFLKAAKRNVSLRKTSYFLVIVTILIFIFLLHQQSTNLEPEKLVEVCGELYAV